MNREFLILKNEHMCYNQTIDQTKKEGNDHASRPKSILPGIESGFGSIVCLQSRIRACLE
jgi:hypothetical protein